MACPKSADALTSQMQAKKYKLGEHPNSLANLRPPFKKGENGNHGKGYSLTAALRDALGDKKKLREFIASTLEGAILREPTPFKEVWERVEGKVPDQHAILGDIVLRVKYDDDSNQGTNHSSKELPAPSGPGSSNR